MPLISLPTLPAEGSKLLNETEFSDVDDPYTLSTYARLGSTADNGLMSSANGRLSYENLHPATQIEAYHIQPEQASLARMDSMLSSSTIYGNGATNVGSDTRFFTVPGCSVRWYQPYATSVSLLQWSFFVSYNAWRGVYKDSSGEVHSQGVAADVLFRCRLDDTVVEGSDRRLGHNMFHPLSPAAPDRTEQRGPGFHAHKFHKDTAKRLASGASLESDIEGMRTPSTEISDGYSMRERGGNPNYVASEMHTAIPVDLHHAVALSKGYHEISVECAITEPDGDSVYLQNVGIPGKTFVTGRGYFHLVGKVSLGVRNARVLNLL